MSRPTAEPRTISAPPVGRPLTFDERLALSPLAMDVRLDSAGVQYDVRTAGIEIPEILVDPLPAAAPAARPGTVDAVFAEAARLIRTRGWIRGYVGHAGVGYCVIGAIRVAAGGSGRLADEACDALFDRIRAEAPDTLSAGAWNDAQSGPGPVIRMLGA
ncbi:hypothetical protein OG730_34910 [Streptomyces sp. NBC_01298]|uniref:DUF6197 family protein n=1 Tax=Streptomyces sp. NBC_01298 TaxID=2903817 RepID=UPI002E130E24|nr:hypothetical protein OG730_34910 [Streptomyces sp. NBC_01298]